MAMTGEARRPGGGDAVQEEDGQARGRTMPSPGKSSRQARK
jgi:hypothetical protein